MVYIPDLRILSFTLPPHRESLRQIPSLRLYVIFGDIVCKALLRKGRNRSSGKEKGMRGG